MSKKNRPRHQPAPAASSAPAPVTPLPILAQEAAALRQEAESITTTSAPDDSASAVEISNIDPRQVVRDALRAKDLFHEAKQQQDKRERELDEKRVVQRKRLEELETREKEFRDAEKSHERQHQAWEQDKTKLEIDFAQREESLRAREADASAGFLKRRTEMLTELDAQIQERLGRANELDSHLLQARLEYEAKLNEQQNSLLAGLDEQRERLRQKEQELAKKLRDAEWELRDAAELKSDLQREIEKRCAIRESELNERLQSALHHIKELAQQLGAREDAERAMGGRSVEQLLAENTALRSERDRQQTELSTRATDEQIQRLQGLEKENRRLVADRDRAVQEKNAAERRESASLVAVTELQNLRDQKTAWECREAALRAAIQSLEDELGVLTKRADQKVPFPALSEMDATPELQQEPPSSSPNADLDLKSLVAYARNAMAQPRGNAPSFFYAETDIRCFIAGMASSRLHLLQGISGTGKSSLPRELARVLGWDSAFVEVQSSWRDRADLLGYHNAFERRFYESPFLQALYRAQCARHAKRPFFIVLDEMNLSHPEHYFADFLSALEKTSAKEKVISLLPSALEPSPRLLVSGRSISIPENVWFIGTANHDETTKDFADKTYDRAHVMEFPRHRRSFDPSQTAPRSVVRWDVLDELFAKAKQDHASAVEDAVRRLSMDLSDPLGKLGLGWGNRLEKQMESFLPVVIAAGGTSGEALDHMLATKLLRKLRGRYDLNTEDFETLQKEIETRWSSESIPEKSIALLEAERKRSGQR